MDISIWQPMHDIHTWISISTATLAEVHWGRRHGARTRFCVATRDRLAPVLMFEVCGLAQWYDDSFRVLSDRMRCVVYAPIVAQLAPQRNAIHTATHDPEWMRRRAAPCSTRGTASGVNERLKGHGILFTLFYTMFDARTGWPKKTAHYTFVHIFAKYWPIFIILSPTH